MKEITWRNIADGIDAAYVAGTDTGARVTTLDIDGKPVWKLDGPLFGIAEPHIFTDEAEAKSEATGIIQDAVETALRRLGIDPADFNLKDTVNAPAGMLRIEDLDRVKGMIKIKRLAEVAGLNPSSIAQKLGRLTQLSVTESEKMTQALLDLGIIVERRGPAR